MSKYDGFICSFGLGWIVTLFAAIWMPSWQMAATSVVFFFLMGCASEAQKDHNKRVK